DRGARKGAPHAAVAPGGRPEPGGPVRARRGGGQGAGPRGEDPRPLGRPRDDRGGERDPSADRAQGGRGSDQPGRGRRRRGNHRGGPDEDERRDGQEAPRGAARRHRGGPETERTGRDLQPGGRPREFGRLQEGGGDPGSTGVRGAGPRYGAAHPDAAEPSPAGDRPRRAPLTRDRPMSLRATRGYFGAMET